MTNNSFFGQLTNISKWFPAYTFFAPIVNDISLATTGVFSLYAAFISSELTVRHYGKNSGLVGVTSVSAYILMFVHTIRNTQRIEMNYYNAMWFIFGIVVGYLVGLIFVKFGNKKEQTDKEILTNIFVNMRPILIVLGIALVISLRIRNLPSISDGSYCCTKRAGCG